MRDYCFFNNVYMNGEMREELKNSSVIPVKKS